MKIPPGFIDEIRNRLPVSEIVGKRVKLIRRGREFVACCPFHNEKTPSFTVNDDKGFFHCFGCGEHGDVVGFIMRHDGLSFPEAVEHCASQVGMTVPQESPAEQEAREKRAGLADLAEAAAAFFQGELFSPRGSAALDYIKERGLDDETIRTWRLGYAPRDAKPLLTKLASIGGKEADLLELGLLRKPDDGRDAYPFFRDRLMFPVGDRRGRIVGFGGRLLSGDGPKYVNSPQSPLFDKGRLLFGYSQARHGVSRGHSPIIVEGYMDVLALARAGFLASVAPLGTALTENQLIEAWRLGPAPVLCFDGDQAGMRAAWRAAERALPLLKPDQTIRFAFLPEGEDPDSLLRRLGTVEMRRFLKTAVPLDAFIWQHEAQARPLEEPTARAGLEAALDRHAGQIADSGVSAHFRQQWRQRVRDTFFASRRTVGRGRSFRPGQSGLQASGRLPNRRPGGSPDRVLLSLILHHPALFEQFGERLGATEFNDPADARLADCLTDHLSTHSGVEFQALASHVAESGHAVALNRLRAPSLMDMAPFVSPTKSDEAAAAAWEDYWSQIERRNQVNETKTGAYTLPEKFDSQSVSRHRALRRAAGMDDFDP